MSKLSNPRLTLSQIDQLKADIKILNKAIMASIKNRCSEKIGVTTSQNAIARELGYKSFSELSLKKVPIEHNSDFSLVESLTPERVLSAYQAIQVNGAFPLWGVLSVDIVSSAMEGLKKESESEGLSIDLQELYSIINADEFNHGHKYREGDGFPMEFTVAQSSRFFSQLNSWDQFIVRCGSESKFYTVEGFDEIYNNTPCFKVVVGLRYENGFGF